MTNEEAIRAVIVAGQTEALQSLIDSGFDDDGIGRAYLAAANTTDTQHVAGSASEEKGKNMHKSFRKLLIDAGPTASIRKSFYDDALQALGEELRQDGDSPQQAYARGMDTPEGIALHDLYKRAPADPPQDMGVPQMVRTMAGPAATEMQVLADLHRKKHPELSREQAYARAFTAASAELRARVKQENIEAAQARRTPPGRRLPFENPNQADAALHATMARTRGP
jgi:hypothetical protein